MIAANHALTGALLGLSIGNPLLAAPAAVASHFVCDALPHYGPGGDTDELLRTRSFAWRLVADAVLCFALVVALAITHPQHWLLAAVCAFLAAAPDFAWLPGYVRSNRGGKFAPAGRSRFMEFAARIQWFERPIGLYVEIAWMAAAIGLLVAYL